MEAYLLLIATVLLGGMSALWLFDKPRVQKMLLTFSGAYLFAVVIFHLLPEIYLNQTERMAHTAGLLILAGLVFQLVLDFFSHGIEHGHEHAGHLHGLTAGMVLGLFLHAFTEGLPVGSVSHPAYLYGILVHKFPIALVMTSFLMSSGLSRGKIISVLVAFSLMSPLGAWLGAHWRFLSAHQMYVTAFVAGLLTHISTLILFETDRKHRFDPVKIFLILLAFGLAYLQ